MLAVVLCAPICRDEFWISWARMVVASGFRIRGNRRAVDATADHFASIARRVASGKIDVRQAMYEARRIRPTFDVIPQLQANFAFAKAYTAEQTGTKGGLAGAKCFLDLSFFLNARPDWISFEEQIQWRHPKLNLSGTFAPVSDVCVPPNRGATPSGFRNGLEIGQFLVRDEDLLSALHSLKPVGRTRAP